MGTCGITCFPVPIGFHSPNDIFKKAQLLSSFYGSVPEETDATPVCVCESSTWSSNKLAGNQSNLNGLSLAIINLEKNIILHFLEKHLDCFNTQQVRYAYLCLLATKQHDLANNLRQRRAVDLYLVDTPVADEQFARTKKYFFIPELLRNNYSNHELAILIKTAINFDIELEFIVLISTNLSKNSSLAFTGKKSKMNPSDSLPRQAIHKGRWDVAEYLLDNHLHHFSSDQLGACLISELARKQSARAKSLLVKRPDINKEWYFEGTNNYPQHLLAALPNADVDLFRLLCESKPVINLSKKNKAGETATSIAMKEKNTAIVNYIVEHQAKAVPNEIAAAKLYLANVDHVARDELELAGFSRDDSTDFSGIKI
jgi:ankyrin repeat protein